MNSTGITAVAWICIALVTSIRADDTTNQPPANVAWSFSKLKQASVQNDQGEKLGAIRDLVFDRGNGRVNYAIISSSGFLGIGSQNKIVPAQALAAPTGNSDIFILNLSQESWVNAPDYGKDVLSQLDTPEKNQQIFAYYQLLWPPAPIARGPAPENVPTPTGRSSGERQATANRSGSVLLASDVSGTFVVNQAHDKVGRITDMLVNLTTGTADFAILDTAEGFDPGKSYAVPLRTLSIGAEKNTCVIDVDRQVMQNARPFSIDEWPAEAASSTQVFLYRIPSLELPSMP